MLKSLSDKIKEAIFSVLPISIIVLIINFFFPLGGEVLSKFIIGVIMLIFGMGLFALGADSSMMVMGETVGRDLIKRKKLWLIIAVAFIIGFIVTIAEPDLTVLSEQFPLPSKYLLIIPVALGVGIFLVLACVRIIFQIKLTTLLIIGYAIVFGVALFINPNFVPIALDSGGVTTGPITVPFILAFGMGTASALSHHNSEDDSFGLVALCSIGPIIAVAFLGLFLGDANIVTEQATESTFLGNLWLYCKDVFIAILPIIVFFLIYNFFALKLKRKEFIKIAVGIVFTYLGLVLFLTGANFGFMPVGNLIGQKLAAHSGWILIIMGAVMGFFTVMAEPAVHVLNKQVESITSGAISKKTMLFSLAIGIGISVAMAMTRIVFQISIWWVVIPGYAIAIGLSFFVPKVFTAIAFDSGGVASGPMAATFILPFSLGACLIIDSERILLDAFGIVALIAMMPLIVIQIVGLVYKIKLLKAEREAFIPITDQTDLDDVINFRTVVVEEVKPVEEKRSVFPWKRKKS